ncbi:CLIP-associating protein 1-A isoform X5 [Tenebrio molitor]
MTYLIDRLGTDFRPYLQTVLPNVIDRLGDAKDTVREKAQLLILKLLERNALSPQVLLEKLIPGFTHKNAKIREEVLRCLLNILNEHGAHSLTISRFIPDIVKLLSDPTSTVRDTAYNTLVDLYKHVGEKLRIDLQRRNIVPPAKWQALSARFNEVKDSGELLLTASRSDYNTDEMDRPVMQKPVIPVKKANLGSGVKPRTVAAVSSANAVLSRVGSMRKLHFSSASAGSVDEDTFTKSFEDVPTVRIFSSREVSDHMKNIQETISDSSKEWNKRVDALKKIRSLILADAMSYEEFFIGLKQMDLHLQAIIKDLRSQVVREACITIAYLAQILGNKFDKTAEVLLLPLINLIQNSAKIMSTSGIVTLKFIIQNIHSSRLIPIIANHAATSKSKDIRRNCCEFLDYILNNWPSHSLERHVAALQETVKKGIADADPDARVSSRKAFRGFREHFPDQAEALLQSLEPSYRRALQGDGMSASSSNNNLAGGFKTPRSYGRTVATPHSATDSGRKGFRSNSAIDLQAAQRAKVRAQYAAMARNKISSGTASLQGEVAQQARPRKSPDTVATQSPERLGRTRNRNSQSQPTSRSGSPSSRLAYLYNRSTEHDSPRPRRLSSGIPRSTTGSRDTSRETSPNRSTLGRFRRGSDRPPLSPASRPVLAQKILQQSREAENALADVFNDSGDHYRSPRKTMRSIDNHSDESETSSVCSERSFDSYRRPSDSYSWSGSQQRLSSRELWEPCRDINEIIALCASTTWQERKDGLLSLQYYVSNEIPLTPGELKYLTEIFTKMFMDSHTKGLSVFLDTLHDVIKVHKNDLHSWVYVLLQRVFLKIGTETLNSVQSKLMATLEIVRSNFPIPLLISNVHRFLLDATQTPNSKVKTVVVAFLATLFNAVDGSQLVWTAPANQVLQKIIAFTQDTKSVELRSAAKNCIVSMWNCNTPQVTMMLSELPKDQQDIARSIVQHHMRKNSTGSEPGSPLVNASPKTLSPGTPPLRGEGLDQEEIYRSLRKTTAEIQNYSYETLGSKLDRDRDTTSQDSGISQMSVGNDIKNDIGILEERMEDLTLRPNFNSRSGPRSLPPYTSVNGISETDSNGYKSLGEWKDSDIVKTIFEKCVVDHPTPIQEKRLLLAQLIDMIKQGQTESIIQNFKKLLRLLIDNLNEKDTNTQVTVLEILSAIFQSKEMKDCWCNFVELLTLRVLNAHCDEKREVVKMAESTAAAMSVCPFNTIVTTLAPLIQTSPYPPVLGAIKMLTKLIETNPDDVTDEHLSMIMPGLIKGTDHLESPVRKSSIFCMVALYKAVGEERLSSYISCLSGSKVKLLRLYISRSQQNTSVPTSPKNSANS